MVRIIILGSRILFLLSLVILALFVPIHGTNNEDRWGLLEVFSTDQEYFTAKEAYEVILPAITSWNPDVVISRVYGGPWHGKEAVYHSDDGRMSYWTFIACSNQAKKWVYSTLVLGSVSLGVGAKPWGTIEGNCHSFPIEDLIDTDFVTDTARSKVKGQLPSSFFLGGCHPRQNTDLICWEIEFEFPDSKDISMYFDAFTGELVNIYRYRSGEVEALGKHWEME
jgi:hypothetical protein